MLQLPRHRQDTTRRHAATLKFGHFLLTMTMLTGSLAGQVEASPASPEASTEPSALLEKHATLATQLARSPFRRPLFIDSAEGNSSVSGNAYAVLAAPFDKFSSTFSNPANWCDVLILHLNTKYCRAAVDSKLERMAVKIGKKTPQSLKDASSLEFNYRLLASSANYLAVRMNAEKGPLGTSNYRIELQATPLPDGRTFMHLGYSYDFGWASRVAMQAYMATAASEKVGFTQVQATQKPALASYVSGVRGAIERNTMRYYLAIEAYMASLTLPPAQQPEQRLRHWFDATEQYRLQLHEVEKEDYLAMKRDEIRRQQNQAPG